MKTERTLCLGHLLIYDSKAMMLMMVMMMMMRRRIMMKFMVMMAILSGWASKDNSGGISSSFSKDNSKDNSGGIATLTAAKHSLRLSLPLNHTYLPFSSSPPSSSASH